MLVITNQVIAGGAHDTVSFPYEGTEFVQGNVNGSKVIIAKTAQGREYTLGEFEKDEDLVEELRRLADADGTAKDYDDKNYITDF
jgi:hypothetical protein